MTQHPVDTLTPYPGNARRGDVDLIAESLNYLGQYRPIVVNLGTLTASQTPNVVLAGNHTLEAAKALGWQTIDCTFVDVDDDKAARIVLIDNRANDKADYDDEALVDLLTELPDLEATGFTRDELDTLLADLAEANTEDEPEPEPTPTKFGVVVECDNATAETRVLERLLAEGFDARAMS